MNGIERVEQQEIMGNIIFLIFSFDNNISDVGVRRIIEEIDALRLMLGLKQDCKRIDE